MSTRFVTDRLRLRDFVASDIDFLARLLSHPQVMQHYPEPLDRDGAERWLQKTFVRYERDGHALWLVELHDGAPIGQVGLLSQEVDGQIEPEIGYMLHADFWHQGYATEAALAVKAYAFDELQLPYVISLIRPVNQCSQRVARRLGMESRRTTQFAGLEHMVFQVDRRAL
ncbi:MAG: GNAT family N-acetyltransferase [Planctomycetaceae bacterium]|nr:GNAT family N-acetyltransferase [Planctomycetaceae bacterium]